MVPRGTRTGVDRHHRSECIGCTPSRPAPAAFSNCICQQLEFKNERCALSGGFFENRIKIASRSVKMARNSDCLRGRNRVNIFRTGNERNRRHLAGAA